MVGNGGQIRIKMVNKRFLEFAQRHRRQDTPKEKSYPSPKSYSTPKSSYYDYLRMRDETHPERVEEALGSIREIYRELRGQYSQEDLIVVAVGTSLVHTAYNDIDVVLLGVKNRDFGEELFDKANRAINGSNPSAPNQNTFLYTGSGFGPSTSDILAPRDYLIDLILDNSGKSFEEWHRMMVNIDQRYCILDRNVEESSQRGNN